MIGKVKIKSNARNQLIFDIGVISEAIGFLKADPRAKEITHSLVMLRIRLDRKLERLAKK